MEKNMDNIKQELNKDLMRGNISFDTSKHIIEDYIKENDLSSQIEDVVYDKNYNESATGCLYDNLTKRLYLDHDKLLKCIKSYNIDDVFDKSEYIPTRKKTLYYFYLYICTLSRELSKAKQYKIYNDDNTNKYIKEALYVSDKCIKLCEQNRFVLDTNTIPLYHAIGFESGLMSNNLLSPLGLNLNKEVALYGINLYKYVNGELCSPIEQVYSKANDEYIDEIKNSELSNSCKLKYGLPIEYSLYKDLLSIGSGYESYKNIEKHIDDYSKVYEFKSRIK